MLRCYRLLVALVVSIAATSAPAQEQSVSFQVADSYPSLSGQLRLGSRLSVELHYRSAVPVGFHVEGLAAGTKVTGATTNIAPAYPPGEGDALVWIAYGKPTTIDELRITAIDQKWKPLGSISQAAQLGWQPEATKQGPAPAWTARLDHEQQELGRQASQRASARTGALGQLVIGLGGLAILGYLVLQPLMLFSLDGGWRIAALVPLVAVAVLGLQAGYAFTHGSNLWPLGLVFLTPLAVLYLLLLGIAHWLLARKSA